MDDRASAPTQKANARSRAARFRTAFIVALLLALAGLAAAAWLSWQREQNEVVTLTIGGGPLGSDGYALIREIADVAERHSDTLRIAVRPSRDSSQSISLLNSRAIDLAAIRADTPVVADVRMVAVLYPDYFQFLVQGGLRAFDVNDLRGLRIAIPEFGTDANRSCFVVADHYDLPLDAISWRAMPFAEAKRGLLAGDFDAMFTVRSLRDPQLVRLFEDAQLKKRELRYLPVSQAEAISLKRPFLRAGDIPAGAFTGASAVPAHDTPTAVVDRVLVSRADVPEKAIRELTSILFEHRLDLALRFPLSAAIAAPGDGLSVALHDGASAYYDREKPGVFEAYTDQIGLLITLAAMAISGLLALKSRFLSSQKNRADRYNYQLLELDRKIDAIASPAELAALQASHSDILRSVVVALDTDEITDEGFQSFSLLWQSVRDRLRDAAQAPMSRRKKT